VTPEEVDHLLDEEVSRRDLARGTGFGRTNIFCSPMTTLSSVKVESSSTMIIEKFVDAGTIDPNYHDTAYYLAPEGEVGRDADFVLREAIRYMNDVALSRVVISQRERTIALRPLSLSDAGSYKLFLRSCDHMHPVSRSGGVSVRIMVAKAAITLQAATERTKSPAGAASRVWDPLARWRHIQAITARCATSTRASPTRTSPVGQPNAQLKPWRA
jgi:hypothetical protein